MESNRNNNTKSKLPSLDHFLLSDAQLIYEPAEDTFLLCDAIQSDIFLIKNTIATCTSPVVLEIGCGSGCVITFISNLLQSEGINYAISYATDINPHAVKFAKKTAILNNVCQQ